MLAAAGLGSRRACEELVTAGRVQVNGRTATLGERVDPGHDVIRLDGALIPTASGLTYLAVNKPRGMHTTMTDDRGRACVGDLLADLTVPLHHVGRLDADSEGLLLFTNDGALTHRLTHPSYGVTKRYLIEVAGVVSRAASRQLRTGVELADGVAAADEIVIVATTGNRTVLEVGIHEGRKHIVRRMLAETGYPVSRLVRVAIGPIRLGDLRPGRYRRLQLAEVRALYREVGL